jgi:enamine deaminase RidA (YjgF/YER057c/UK114 family)
MIFLSGFGPWKSGGTCIQGRLPKGLTVEEGYAAARLWRLNLLATRRADFETLDGVERIVKVLGFVASPPDFTGHSSVIHDCTELFFDLFGDEGSPARDRRRQLAPVVLRSRSPASHPAAILALTVGDKRGFSSVRNKIGKRTSAN